MTDRGVGPANYASTAEAVKSAVDQNYCGYTGSRPSIYGSEEIGDAVADLWSPSVYMPTVLTERRTPLFGRIGRLRNGLT